MLKFSCNCASSLRWAFTHLQEWQNLVSIDGLNLTIYPNCDNLFNSLIIFPGSASCVERLFSKLKLLRNGPQNQFSHLILESLLMIATDSLKQDPSENTFKLKRRNPSMRLKL